MSLGDGHLYVDEATRNPIVTTALHEVLYRLKRDAPDLADERMAEVARQSDLPA